MESDPPTWLNEHFVRKILRNAEADESIEVSDFLVKAATRLGENYGSDMLRVSVKILRVREDQEITEERSLLAKITPKSKILKEMVEAGSFFETEISLMSEALPKMSRLLEELDAPQLAARCLYFQHENPTHLIIEDLTPKGFRMADHGAKGLDLDHCLLAMRKLALFHASSVALEEREPTAISNYNTRVYINENQNYTIVAYYKEAAKVLGETVAQWSDLDPRISEKLIKLSETIFEKICEVVRCREDDFNVLNHGDYWANNMLFRYDEHQKPIAHVFVDFQISYYGSPAMDILHFISSTSDDVRLNHYELLLREYHGLLTSTMVKLKCSTRIPSFEQLQEILRERAFYRSAVAIAGLPLLLLDKSEAKTMEEILEPATEPGAKPGYQGKLFRKIMTRELQLFDSMGLLDS